VEARGGVGRQIVVRHQSHIRTSVVYPLVFMDDADQ